VVVIAPFARLIAQPSVVALRAYKQIIEQALQMEETAASTGVASHPRVASIPRVASRTGIDCRTSISFHTKLQLTSGTEHRVKHGEGSSLPERVAPIDELVGTPLEATAHRLLLLREPVRELRQP
tara:strand:- start:239 stop:613 length:375 start_codon:yes stop_codon:yes gene_type:complete